MTPPQFVVVVLAQDRQDAALLCWNADPRHTHGNGTGQHLGQQGLTQTAVAIERINGTLYNPLMGDPLTLWRFTAER